MNFNLDSNKKPDIEDLFNTDRIDDNGNTYRNDMIKINEYPNSNEKDEIVNRLFDEEPDIKYERSISKLFGEDLKNNNSSKNNHNNQFEYKKEDLYHNKSDKIDNLFDSINHDNQESNRINDKTTNRHINLEIPDKSMFEMNFLGSPDKIENKNDIAKFNTGFNVDYDNLMKTDIKEENSKMFDFDNLLIKNTNNIISNPNANIDFDNIKFDFKNNENLEKKFSSANQINKDHLANGINKKLAKFSSNQPESKIIINFKKIIDSEKRYGKSKLSIEDQTSINTRKDRIINDNSFSTSLYFNNNKLTPYLNNIDSDVLDLQIESIFQDMLQVFDIESKKNELDFFFLDSNYNHSPISFLSSINNMVEISKNNSHQFSELLRDIKYWRKILGDGNCFYRSFMFAVIENHILNKDLYALKLIIYDINNINNKYHIEKIFNNKNEIIDKNEINMIFYLILNYLNNDEILLAYDTFIKAYYITQTFDYGMIKYMRIAMYNYISSHQDDFYSSESQIDIGNLLPSLYIQNNKYNFDAFYKEYLLSMHSEAEKIIIYLAPIVFNLSLDLFIIEGTARMKLENIKYFKLRFPCLDKKRNSISLLYRFNHYDVVYSNNHYQKYSNFIAFQFIEGSLYNKRYDVFTECMCDQCKTNTELITFNHIPNQPFCKICMIKNLKTIISNRVNAYIGENYVNKEYYCRPIKIEENKNFLLYDEDFLNLFDMTISQYFLLVLENSCPICNKFQEGNNLITLNCNCKLCESCLKSRINKFTDNKIILNDFEKKNMKVNPLCSCGVEFNIDKAIKLIFRDIDNYTKKASVRMKNIIQEICLICCKKIIQAEDIMRSSKILLNGCPEHVLCKSCGLSLRNSIKKEQLQKNAKIIPIDCSICSIKHEAELKNLRSIMRNEEGGCCLIF